MVSIIVAVYNTEKYLRDCLDSLRRQTYSDIQVVCVDDGSTDNSWLILKEYASLDSRFVVIKKNINEGQAIARNEALQHVTGELVCMLDSDDWFSDDAIEKAVEVFNKYDDVDCVLFDLIINGESYKLLPFETESAISGVQAFEFSLTWKLHGLYMTRTDLHKKYTFDTSARSFSDDNTTRIHYLKSRKVMRCMGHYYYRQHENSVSHAIDILRFDLLKANDSMAEQLKKLGVSSALISKFERERWINLIGMYMFYFVHRRQLNPKEREYALTELKYYWRTIDVSQKDVKLISWKFGYMPIRCSWRLFRLQEEIYFALRQLMGKNKR